MAGLPVNNALFVASAGTSSLLRVHVTPEIQILIYLPALITLSKRVVLPIHIGITGKGRTLERTMSHMSSSIHQGNELKSEAQVFGELKSWMVAVGMSVGACWSIPAPQWVGATSVGQWRVSVRLKLAVVVILWMAETRCTHADSLSLQTLLVLHMPFGWE